MATPPPSKKKKPIICTDEHPYAIKHLNFVLFFFFFFWLNRTNFLINKIHLT